MHRKDTAIVLSGVGADSIRPLFRLAARATFPEGEGFCQKITPVTSVKGVLITLRRDPRFF